MSIEQTHSTHRQIHESNLNYARMIQLTHEVCFEKDEDENSIHYLKTIDSTEVLKESKMNRKKERKEKKNLEEMRTKCVISLTHLAINPYLFICLRANIIYDFYNEVNTQLIRSENKNRS